MKLRMSITHSPRPMETLISGHCDVAIVPAMIRIIAGNMNSVIVHRVST